jgi:formate dehydrogenase subunit delta
VSAPSIRLAGDIAAQFRHVPADRGAAAVAGHIRQFWDPRMRRQLLAELDAGAEVDPLVTAAADLLRPT